MQKLRKITVRERNNRSNVEAQKKRLRSKSVQKNVQKLFENRSKAFGIAQKSAKNQPENVGTE